MNNYAEDFSLKEYNTFGFDVETSFWATFADDRELVHVIRHCKQYGLKWFILGGGSNIIFTDKFDGMVIHPVAKSIVRDRDIVIAEAGVVWDDFVEWTVRERLGGVENLSFIPGSVGASPVQNIGAYGVEVKDCIDWVEYLDTDTMQIVKIAGADCEFGYRESVFKRELKGRSVVLRVAFRLIENPQSFNIEYGDVRAEVEKLGGATLANIRQAITSIREAKLPDPNVVGNAGSFFKNPVIDNELAAKLLKTNPNMPHYVTGNRTKIPAGWLIDQSGWKGYRTGDAGVHPKQALVLVNYGTATAKDILNLADNIVADVNAKFGIILEKEVNIC